MSSIPFYDLLHSIALYLMITAFLALICISCFTLNDLSSEDDKFDHLITECIEGGKREKVGLFCFPPLASQPAQFWAFTQTLEISIPQPT